MSACLIVAHSARQLAAAAVAAGFRPVVADCFGDRDTRSLANRYIELPCRNPGVLDADAALEILATLEGNRLPIVWGGGLEGHLDFLRALANHGELLGTALESVAMLTDPKACSARLHALQIPHPCLADAPRAEGDWLLKTRGAAGGEHVRPYRRNSPIAVTEYLQQRVVGQSYSLTFVAAAGVARPLAFNQHLNLQPDPLVPYRYGGAIAPASLPHHVMVRCAEYADALTATWGLRGLCGFDFIWDGSEIYLVDINPRPTATFDLQLDPATAFYAHLNACRDRAIALPVPSSRARGHLVCYAPHPIRIPKSLDWPPWTADRPLTDAIIPIGAPVCTLYADGAEGTEVEASLRSRLVALWLLLAA